MDRDRKTPQEIFFSFMGVYPMALTFPLTIFDYWYTILISEQRSKGFSLTTRLLSERDSFAERQEHLPNGTAFGPGENTVGWEAGEGGPPAGE